MSSLSEILLQASLRFQCKPGFSLLEKRNNLVRSSNTTNIVGLGRLSSHLLRGDDESLAILVTNSRPHGSCILHTYIAEIAEVGPSLEHVNHVSFVHNLAP